MPERTPTVGEMRAALRRIAADDSLNLADPTWTTFTDPAMGIAPGQRDGRVPLAGDVGHPILPDGGQGMNTGIGDAFHPAPTLAAIAVGTGPDALLDTYDVERHTLRRSLQDARR